MKKSIRNIFKRSVTLLVTIAMLLTTFSTSGLFTSATYAVTYSDLQAALNAFEAAANAGYTDATGWTYTATPNSSRTLLKPGYGTATHDSTWEWITASESALQPGDLLILGNTGHVMVYYGRASDGDMIFMNGTADKTDTIAGGHVNKAKLAYSEITGTFGNAPTNIWHCTDEKIREAIVEACDVVYNLVISDPDTRTESSGEYQNIEYVNSMKTVAGAEHWCNIAVQFVLFCAENPTGYLTLTKTPASGLPECVTNNSAYSLSEAVYGVYSSTSTQKPCSESTRVGTLTTKSDGTTDPIELDAGTYYVKELTASKGYAVTNPSVGYYTVTVTSGKTETLSVTETTNPDPNFFYITKKDDDSGAVIPADDIRFNVTYSYTDNSGRTVPVTYVYESIDGIVDLQDTDYLVSGDPIIDVDGNIVFYAGTVTITESSASTGYVLNRDEKVVFNVTVTNGQANMTLDRSASTNGQFFTLSGNNLTWTNETIKTGGVKFGKIDADRDTAVAQGDVIYTSKTFTVSDDDESITVTANDGFTASGTVTVELDVDNELVQGKSIVVYEELYHNGVLVGIHSYSFDEDGDLVIDPSQVVYYPTGKTNATYDGTETHSAYAGTVTITDSVYFENLLTGEEYTIEGDLTFVKGFIDSEGAYHNAGDIAAESEVTFTTAADMADAYDVIVTTQADGTQTVSGYIDVVFEVDASLLAGATLVTFEDFYHEDALIFSHADISDAPQTIKIPAIATSALSDTGIDEASSRTYNSDTKEYAWNTVTIIDTVTYENLWTQAELDALAESAKTIESGAVDSVRDTIYEVSESALYTVSGYLVDAETGEAIVDNDGNKVTATASFEATAESGSVDVTYTIDLNDFINEDGSCRLEGRTLVAFEELYQTASDGTYTDSALIADHKDAKDEAQSVQIPKVTTDLKDTVDGDRDALVAEDITLIDVVSYENLTVGNEYTVSGILMNKETGEPALDDNGNTITSKTTFTAASEDGSVELTFTFSGVSLAGESVVAFETVTRDGIEVAVHTDITDDDQTVDIPKISTSLADEIDMDKDALAGDVTLIDTV